MPQVCTGSGCEQRPVIAPRPNAPSLRTAQEVFDSLDADGDGRLSLSEMEARLLESGLEPDDVAQLFSLLDSDGDGFVDRAEFGAGFVKYQSLEQGGVSSRELLRQWAASKPHKLASSQSSVAVCPGQCCPAPAHKVGLLKDEPRRVVFVGCTGSGKSSLCTALTGQEWARDTSTFKIGNGARSETTGCTAAEHFWFGSEAEGAFRCVDTPGLNDSEGADEQHLSSIIGAMKQLDYVNAIVLVLNGTDPRFSRSLQDAVARFERAFCGEARGGAHENFYDNLIVCFQRWKTNDYAVEERRVGGVTEQGIAKGFCDQFRAKFPHVKNRARDLRCVFVDSHDLDQERRVRHLRALKDAIPADVFRTGDLEQIVPRLQGYDAEAQPLVQGKDIIPMRPRLVDPSVKVTSWHVEPTLPAGLALCPQSGVISGRPSFHSPPKNYSVVAESVGGKGKPHTIPSIEVRLSREHVESITRQHRGKIEGLLSSAVPNLEGQAEVNLDSVISGWDSMTSEYMSKAKAELEDKFQNMSQLPDIVASIMLGCKEIKTNLENNLRARYAKHSKAQHEARLKLEKLDNEIQRLMLTGAEDYHLFKRKTEDLESMNPASGSPASITLEKAQRWLEEITPTKCSNPSCPHVGLRRNQQRHASSCLFNLQLITQNAVKRSKPDDCSLGFELRATLECNPEFVEYAGSFKPGPSQHMNDDEEGWFHFVDFPKQRIIRIKSVSERWVLTCWEGPKEEREILWGSDSKVVDQANFEGFEMFPMEKLSWAEDGVEGKVAKDSIKLMYFGGMWCPYCPPFTKRLKIFFDIVREEVGKDLVEIIFISSDRDEDAMLEYYGNHHGEWFALPFADRTQKRNLNEKYGVGGIPSLHVIGNDAEEVDYFREGGPQDIGSMIRGLPDSKSEAKGKALELYETLRAKYMPEVEGLLGLDYNAVIQSVKNARGSDSCNANLLGDLKNLKSGNFEDAARGLQTYLKTSSEWDEKELCTLEGIKAEVLSLIDCPDCAAVQASELSKLEHTEAAGFSSRLADALKALKSGEDTVRSLHSERDKTRDPAEKENLLRQLTETKAGVVQLKQAVHTIRREAEEAGMWYYGCQDRPIKWPAHVCDTYTQPMCAKCKGYRLDYSTISKDLNYVLQESSSEATFFNGVRDCGRAGATLQTFMDSEEQREAKLTEAEVASLRFYTSHSFGCINEALRDPDREGPHPLPALVTCIQSGLRKLRAVGAKDKGASETVVLWRGFRDTQHTEAFMRDGGTELAPMSTTTDVGVAVGYAVRNGQTSRSLLFRIVTDNNLQRGADLRWLSMFPGEAETLYPPLTFMQPTGRKQTVKVDGFELEVVEVKATIS